MTKLGKGKLEDEFLIKALQEQADGEAHDRSLIVERLDQDGEQPSAYQRLQPFIGIVDSGGQQLSQGTGRRLREFLKEKRKPGRPPR